MMKTTRKYCLKFHMCAYTRIRTYLFVTNSEAFTGATHWLLDWFLALWWLAWRSQPFYTFCIRTYIRIYTIPRAIHLHTYILIIDVAALRCSASEWQNINGTYIACSSSAAAAAAVVGESSAVGSKDDILLLVSNVVSTIIIFILIRLIKFS